MIFDRLMRRASMDLAVDLGTANTLIYRSGAGIVCNEPSVVAIERTLSRERRVVAVGADAKRMLGRTPGHIDAIRPLREGVIADFEIAETLLRYFLRKARGPNTLLRPRVLLSVPFGCTEVEKRAVREAARSAGAREVGLVLEPVAAALGAGLPMSGPSGSMIVDIGGGTTEVAVLSLAGVVFSCSVRIGGDQMDAAVLQHIKRKHNLLIGEQTAEQVKQTLGAAYPLAETSPRAMTIQGRDLLAGVPKTIRISDEEVREALAETVERIIEAVRATLERCPPELSADIVDEGIVLAGGGALLGNLSERIHRETGLAVRLCESPLTAVALGAGRILDGLARTDDITFE